MDTKCQPFIYKDCDGNVLISLEQIDELTLSQNPFLTRSISGGFYVRCRKSRI